MKEFHPIANLFPLMQGSDFNEHKQSVKSSGLNYAITLFEDKILDGRNRARACEELGIEPRYEEYTGSDPFAFVAAQNLHRRHLTISQRAKIAAKMATMTHGGDRKSKQDVKRRLDRYTIRQAAARVNVGASSAERARYVTNNGIPEVVKAMDEDKIHVDAAKKIALLPKDEQLQALSDKLNGKSVPATKKQPKVGPSRQAINERRRETLDNLPKLRGYSREEVDPDLADKPFEFASKYGFVNLHTKEQVENDKDKAAFSQWIGAIKKLRVPLKELLKIDSFKQSNIARWIRRASDPSKFPARYAEMEEMLNLFAAAHAAVVPHIAWLPTQNPSANGSQR